MLIPHQLPYLGFGLGLRSEHHEYVCKAKPAVDWFEIITENYLMAEGRSLGYLAKIRENYPLVMHGVSLSVGGSDPLHGQYLQQVKTLANVINPVWISDHLCWTGIDGVYMHDLLPLPYTEEAVKHVAARVRQVQDFLGCRILLENVSSYLTYTVSAMTEWEFISAVVEEADCFILLDINNIFVSAYNHGFNPSDYLHGIPKHRVQQMHLAGHCQYETYILDTHDSAISPEVWGLYSEAIQYLGPVSTSIERDDNLTSFVELCTEVEKARAMALKIQLER